MDKFPITQQGYADLQEEIKRLKTVERPEVTKQIQVAREHGDLSENAEYHAAREKQGFIEGRLMDLEDKHARAEVIAHTELSGDTIKFGATVLLVDEDTDEETSYQIVGEYEADINVNRISIISPIARALIGRSVGDSVEVITPKGSKSYEVLKVEFI